MPDSPASPAVRVLPPPPAPTIGHPLSTGDLPTLNDALGALHTDLQGLRAAADLVATSAAGARRTADAADQVVSAAGQLARPTQALLDRVDRVDFPARLDKLDATTAALYTGLQATQARVDALSRALQDAHSKVMIRFTTLDAANRAAQEESRTHAHRAARIGWIQTGLLLLALAVVTGILLS